MRNDRIRHAVEEAIRETVGPRLAAYEAIRRVAGEGSDDADLGRRVRAIIDAADAAHVDAVLDRESPDGRELPKREGD
jgi:hypothetical protein